MNNLNSSLTLGTTTPSYSGLVGSWTIANGCIGTITNLNNMKTKQVKAAVFTIERNDKNEIVSSKFVKELWVEVKNGTSLDLVVAKELKGEFDPETIVVR
jgi:hypothetical protein